MIQKLYYFLHHLVLRKQYTVQNFHFMQMLCESSLWSMGYQEHIQQTESHSNGVGQRELTSDHENSTEQNVHLYKLHRIWVYTCWFDHSQLSEIHHTESRKKKKTRAQSSWSFKSCNEEIGIVHQSSPRKVFRNLSLSSVLSGISVTLPVNPPKAASFY